MPKKGQTFFDKCYKILKKVPKGKITTYKDLAKALKTKAYEDLELMKACKHNIITNSALSWWAGYLNTNTQKMVIAPKNFTHFKEAKSVVLPKEWIRI